MPMSITAAPGFTMSARRNFGLPTTTSTASARRERAATERVMWWHTVTVAPSAISMKAAGLPTISEWPTITTSSPCSCSPVALISSTVAAAVNGARARSLETMSPMVGGESPAVEVQRHGTLQDHAEHVVVIVHRQQPGLALVLGELGRPRLLFEPEA